MAGEPRRLRKPRRCQVVGVVDKELRPAGAAVAAGHHPKVDLDAVPGGEAVAASSVCTDGEAESLVMRHRRVEVMDGKRLALSVAGCPRGKPRMAISG